MPTTMKRGDLVEVKNAAEILATLDGNGTLEGLLFMPEMIPYCGRRFTVARRADKICDTIQYTGSRRLREAVLLDDLRCDGSHHDDCQAECRLFWKEQWLRRVTPETPPGEPAPSTTVALLRARTAENTRVTSGAGGQPQDLRYRCQATELQRCTEHLKLWDPMSYIREYTSGNVTLGHFLKVLSRAAVQEPMRKLGLTSEIHVRGTAGKDEVHEALNLQPGELVRVKPLKEIVKTLTPGGRNKGLWFDREMMQYCGQTFRVRQRISRFINDQDRRMIALKNDAVTLEGAVCTGDLSQRRWFCSRAIYPYWRECWLERVSTAEQPSRPSRAGSCSVGCS
jgi:hypothetical protein